MAKNPIMPLYYNDILGSTKTWTDEEFGAYVRLLIEQWDKGILPKDPKRLNKIADTVGQNWPILKEKFSENENGYFNEKMEEIREKTRNFSKSQTDKATKRHAKSLPNVCQNDTKNLPLEYEYEIEIEKELEKEYDISYVAENFKKPFYLFLAYRKEIKKKYKSSKSLQGCYDNLVELSNNNAAEAIKIVSQSINNQWQGLFPFKENGKQQSISNKDRTESIDNLHNLSSKILGQLAGENSTGST